MTANKTAARGYFITFEGIEGVGKSTSLAAVKKYLETANIPFILTREPGGTPIAEAIRQVLLNQHTEVMTHDTELLLMFAGRAQHIAHVIKPALAEKKWILCDRFTDATYAYQGGGRGMNNECIASLEQWVQGNLRPDLTLLLDAPLQVALSRAKHRSSPDRFESEKEQFFAKVRDAYLARAKQYPTQYRIIDASLPQPEVLKQILGHIQSLIQN